MPRGSVRSGTVSVSEGAGEDGKYTGGGVWLGGQVLLIVSVWNGSTLTTYN